MAQTLCYANYYQTVQIQTSDPLSLILLLYEGAIRHLKQAANSMENGDMQQRHRAIDKALAMIGELQASLDLEKGRQVAASLDRLYNYMVWRITQSNLKHSPEMLREVVALLETLNSAWVEVQNQVQAEASQQRLATSSA